MSYYEAIEDGIPMEKDKKGFTWYYPPCRICKAPVSSWKYIRGSEYICKDCKTMVFISSQKIREAKSVETKEKKLKEALKRISKVGNIKDYDEGTAWVRENYHKTGWFQSTEEIMTALELMKCNIEFQHQLKICDYTVDFILPTLKVALEIDGRIYHKTKSLLKEKMRDEVIMTKLGSDWEMIRIETDNINTNVTRLIPAIKTLLSKRKRCAQ